MKLGANAFLHLTKEQLSHLKWKYAIIGMVIGMVSVAILNEIFKIN